MYRLILVLQHGCISGTSGDLRTVLAQGRLSRVPCYIIRNREEVAK
jgi:hypothetical protein